MTRFGARRPDSLALPELIRACTETGNTEAWEEFVKCVHPVISATVFRTARRFHESSRIVVEDLVQETYVRICANRCRMLRDFHAEDPDAIFGFLKTVAFNVVMDHFRSSMAAKRGAGQADHALDAYTESAVASQQGVASADRQVLLEQIDTHLGATDIRPVDRRIFWLYYRHGMTTRAIAAVADVGLTQKGVESTIQRLTAHVRAWMTGTGRKAAPEQKKGQPPENAAGKTSATTM